MCRTKLLCRIIGVCLLLALVACDASGGAPEDTPKPADTPTPDSAPGVVDGVLQNAAGEPVANAAVGLLRFSPSDEEAEGEVVGGYEVSQFLTVDGVFRRVVDSGMQAATDDAGAFTFESVTPGSYTLWVRDKGTVMRDDEDEVYVFEVLPGQAVNLVVTGQ